MSPNKQQAEYRDGHGFIAEVIRTARRKTADVRVEDGAVAIVVPQDTTAETIDRVLASKRRWITDKLTRHQQAQPLNPRQFVSGEAFAYLGRNYRLKVEQGPFAPVVLKEGRLIATLPEGRTHPHMVRNALVRWYKRQAQRAIEQRVTRYQEQVGVTPRSISVRTFKSRWGSCTAKGDVAFHWAIMMAPSRMVDYIVIHELCHLKRHDHSPAFWKEVERLVPNYRECRDWMKDNAHRLGW